MAVSAALLLPSLPSLPPVFSGVVDGVGCCHLKLGMREPALLPASEALRDTMHTLLPSTSSAQAAAASKAAARRAEPALETLRLPGSLMPLHDVLLCCGEWNMAARH